MNRYRIRYLKKSDTAPFTSATPPQLHNIEVAADNSAEAVVQLFATVPNKKDIQVVRVEQL